jgi:hypothetical protein
MMIETECWMRMDDGTRIPWRAGGHPLAGQLRMVSHPGYSWSLEIKMDHAWRVLSMSPAYVPLADAVRLYREWANEKKEGDDEMTDHAEDEPERNYAPLPWQELTAEELRELYEEGESLQTLADRTGRCLAAVRRQVIEAGGTIRGKGRPSRRS